jgi:hypothetical protein
MISLSPGSWRIWSKASTALMAVIPLMSASTTLPVAAVSRSEFATAAAPMCTARVCGAISVSIPDPLINDTSQLYTLMGPPRGPWRRGVLTWRPPVCGDATHVCATDALTNTGHHQYLGLDSSKDWIVKLPNVPLVGGIDINGGHNVIIIGGEIDLPTPCTTDNSPCHGINISMGSGSTGEVYIEGVLIKNPDPTHSSYTGDGIDVDTDAMSNLTIQNVRIEGVDGCNAGAYPDAHADVFQPYKATNAVIQVDHLTGSTDYQGMQIPADLSWPQRGDYRNVNIDILPNTHSGCAGNGPRYAWWMTADNPACGAYRMNLINDYAWEPNGSLATNAVWPDTDANFGCAAGYQGGVASWPRLSSISGGIRNGLPAGGDFVPAGRAGITYQSPGYQ